MLDLKTRASNAVSGIYRMRGFVGLETSRKVTRTRGSYSSRWEEASETDTCHYKVIYRPEILVPGIQVQTSSSSSQSGS